MNISTDHQYIIEHLDNKHEKSSFSCGIGSLDSYLQTQAKQDTKKNVAVTYVATKNNDKMILGYYTLSSIGIFPDNIPEDLIKKLPRYPTLPGVLIGRLAVDKSHQQNKIGTFLLVDALKRSLEISRQMGIVAIIVHAINENAAKFYKKYGFIEFVNDHLHLFLPISTIEKLAL
jgi:ribosomal protein S18 acetylase RimI-like enzyme